MRPVYAHMCTPVMDEIRYHADELAWKWPQDSNIPLTLVLLHLNIGCNQHWPLAVVTGCEEVW